MTESHVEAGEYSMGKGPCRKKRMELIMRTAAVRETMPPLTLWFLIGRQIRPAMMGKRIDRPSRILITNFPYASLKPLSALAFVESLRKRLARLFKSVINDTHDPCHDFTPYNGICLAYSSQVASSDNENLCLFRGLNCSCTAVWWCHCRPAK